MGDRDGMDCFFIRPSKACCKHGTKFQISLKKSSKFLDRLRGDQLVTTILLPVFLLIASVYRNHLHFTPFCKYIFKFVVSEKRFYALTLTSLEYPNCSKQNQTYVFFGKKVASLRAVKTITPSATCKEVTF